MKILIIQENGRHESNRKFRECFCLLRGFQKLGIETEVWGLGHENFKSSLDFNGYDLILNLENYGDGWEPDLSNVKSKKLLWSIDSHVKGEAAFLNEYNRGKYDLLLHSTKDFVNEKFKIWFPNAFDDTLIFPIESEKKYDVGFCGSLLNRKNYISLLYSEFNFKHDNFVIGDKMVQAINSYKIHWNRNLSNDINYRNFETIGCGVPLVTNYNYQYDELGFIDGETVIFYRNDFEMINSIKNLLKNEEMINTISKKSIELSKKHTYFERTKLLLKIFQNLN
jgi:spore maturation protein CgeB